MSQRDFEASHSPPEQIEAAVFGWLPAREAQVIRAHAVACAQCRPLWEAEEEVRDRLALLRDAEARVDVAAIVLQRIAGEPPRRRRLMPTVARAVLAVLGLALVSTLLLAPGALEAAGRWLQTVIVRPVPEAGQPGAPPVRVGTPGPTGAPIRPVSLDEAQRLASFPVALPRTVPAGFTLADVTIFQPDPTAPPSRVFVTYRRPGAHQPLVLTYQPAGETSELPVSPAGMQQLVVAGHRALYLDLAAEGARPRDGSGEALQLGRLIVERPDVVLSATGDRRDGFDVEALAAVLASVP